MKKILGFGIGIVVLLVVLFLVLGLVVVSTYNGLVSSDEAVSEAWSNVETNYQRRLDLIPNLVATVQGSADFESETQAKIVALRTQAMNARQDFDQATTLAAKADAVQIADSSLSDFLVLVENYPALRSTSNFMDLQAQLEGTENRISVSRQAYNQAVKEYNLKVRSFPAVFIAGFLGFETKQSFDAKDGSDVAPVVAFD